MIDKSKDMTDGKEWVHKRHSIFRTVAGPAVEAYCRLRFPGLRLEKFHDGRQFVMLYNHQTGFDQFFVSLLVKRPVYHVASEDIFSIGKAARVMEHLAAPIPIKKQRTDIRAVRNCVKVAREGGSIAIAPEGNRTFDGRTVHIDPAIGKMVRMIGLPVAIVRIEGGYGTEPRWMGKVRPGKMRVRVSAVIETDEVMSMSCKELTERIRRELYNDESMPGGRYPGRRTAEHMERLFYVCPSCGFSDLVSRGRVIRCPRCGAGAEYTAGKQLVPTDGRFPFRSIREWYDYQCGFVRAMDPDDHTEAPVFTDGADILKVQLYQRKIPLSAGALVRLYGDRMEIANKADAYSRIIRFDDVETATVAGRNKLNLYTGGELLQIKGGTKFNALKYVNFIYRYKSHRGGDNVEFLGL